MTGLLLIADNTDEVAAEIHITASMLLLLLTQQEGGALGLHDNDVLINLYIYKYLCTLP